MRNIFDRLQSCSKNKKVDGFCVTNPENIFYLTGFSGSFGVLLVEKDKTTLLTDMRYVETAKNLAKKNKLEILFLTAENKEKIAQKFQGNFLAESSIRITESKFYKKIFKNIRFHFSETFVEILRQKKTPEEIQKTKKACTLADKIFKEFLPQVSIGKTEKELEKILRMQILTQDLEPSFDPIIAFGASSACPHAKASSQKLQKNQNILIDFGVKFENYCSDMTRNLWIGKTVDPLYLEKYEKLLACQKQVLEKAISGTKIKTLEIFARKFLGEDSENFTHSLGHGIGLEVHEGPNVSQKSKEILEPGMIITIEPGVYFSEQFGIRIEDTVLITENEPVILTQTKKELVIL